MTEQLHIRVTDQGAVTITLIDTNGVHTLVEMPERNIYKSIRLKGKIEIPQSPHNIECEFDF